MGKIYTGINDVHGNKIYSNDKVKYSYFRCSRLSHINICIVEWGYDEVEKREGWMAGGDLIETIGRNNNKKEIEILEVLNS